jgi:hypothetical protein
MSSNLGRGVVAGLISGVVIGLILQFVTVSGPGGTDVFMMKALAESAGAHSVIVGWLVHLIDFAVMGAVFGAIFGSRSNLLSISVNNGVFFGLCWWVLGSFILKPFYFALSFMSPMGTTQLSLVSFGSLLGHFLFGLVLGAAYGLLSRRRGGEMREVEDESFRRAG